MNTLKKHHYRRKRTPLLLMLVGLAVALGSCNHTGKSNITQQDRDKAYSAAQQATTPHEAETLLRKLRSEGNTLGEIYVLRQQGKTLRNENQFEDALNTHDKELKLAEQLGDTLEWVQALNNIGTVYRRMGILDAAQQYHYQAWTMSRETSDTSFTAKKNRLASLNGLGNVYLMAGNLQRADSALRIALRGEAELGEDVGQAINYANIGSILEKQGKTDSAWVYYRHSMALNLRANNALGISLCHTFFGNLYEKAGQYDQALYEYQKAYHLTNGSKDAWHTLNTVVALAKLHQRMGNEEESGVYLREAEQMATAIKSKEHLRNIYMLRYEACKRNGDYGSALTYHEKAAAQSDSLINMEKMNRIQNTSLKIERDQQHRIVETAKEALHKEQQRRQTGQTMFGVVTFLLVGLLVIMVYTQRTRIKGHRALKRLARTRENFFTNVTHEFRTPLTVILGLCQDLQQPSLTADAAHGTGKAIERQGRRLLVLINQLLDISKVKSAIGTPEWRNGNIATHLQMIVDGFQEYAEKRKIKLQFVARDADFETNFVPDYMSKMVGNLVSNALKFTPQYGSVSVAMYHEGRKSLCIDVTDTGIGIAKDDIPHLFEPFYQANQEACTGGTGIGLALVRQIVSALEGTVSVESTVGKGTTFHLQLPIRHEKATEMCHDEGKYPSPMMSEQGKPKEQKPTESGKNDRRILVVEDNADLADYIAKCVGGKCVVYKAVNGQEGMEKAREIVPDAIISDVMMPVMDGLELCKKVREDEVTCHIPVIMITAKVTENDRIRGLEAGADAYLSKPFSQEELRVRLEKLMSQRRMLQEKYAAQQTETAQTEEKKRENGKQQGQAKASLATKGAQMSITKVNDVIYSMINSGKTADVNAVAEKLCMSYIQFYRKLSALTGYTPAQYIQRVKVGKAQRMIKAHPELSLNEVAMLCGFGDYSNFIRAFRNVTGITPTQYVRQLQ